MHKSLKLSLIGAGLALAMPLAALAATHHHPAPPPAAEWWHHHPHYLQAMSDVRTAYWLIQHRERTDPPARPEEARATLAIRYAYYTLKDASAVDRKNVDEQPPADMNYYDYRGRLHHALDLLHEAHDAVNMEEDDRSALGLKAKALADIDAATRDTDEAIHVLNF